MLMQSTETTPLTGFLLLDKPAGVSSFYCVNKIKHLLPRKTKVGHTGTLDEFATGLLIICIGREATKQATTLTGLDKTYFVKAKFGELTDTLDCTGTIIQSSPTTTFTKEQIKNAMTQLTPFWWMLAGVSTASTIKTDRIFSWRMK